jgi:hypothetical protein
MKYGSRIGFKLFVVAVAAAGFITGCATAVPLQTEASASGIRAAEESGATEVPKASLHLQLAREELALARRLAAKGEKEQADSMLKRSEADAELAVAYAHQESEKAEAMAAVARAQELQKNN